MKSNYNLEKSDVEKRMFKYYDSVADGLCRQAFAIVLYAFHLMGWRKKRLNRLFDQLVSMMDMPMVMGKYMEAADCMRMLEEKYGIDFSRITVQKESFREFRKR